MCSYRYGQQFKSKALIKLFFILVLSDCYLTTSGSSVKIIGGRKAALGEFPATVCLFGKTRCGGTLVTLATVISAAHCFFRKGRPINPSGVLIIGGTVDLYEESGDRQESYVKDYIVHDKYKCIYIMSSNYYLNDIVLAFLETAFIETKTVKPAFFPVNNRAGMREYIERMKASNATCLGTGYGAFVRNSKIGSRYLKVAELNLLADALLPELIEYEVLAISKNDYDLTSFGDSGSTFFCGGQIVGLTKGGFDSLMDDKNVTILIFTLFGPYFEDFGLGGCCGRPYFRFLPLLAILLLRNLMHFSP